MGRARKMQSASARRTSCHGWAWYMTFSSSTIWFIYTDIRWYTWTINSISIQKSRQQVLTRMIGLQQHGTPSFWCFFGPAHRDENGMWKKTSRMTSCHPKYFQSFCIILLRSWNLWIMFAMFFLKMVEIQLYDWGWYLGFKLGWLGHEQELQHLRYAGETWEGCGLVGWEGGDSHNVILHDFCWHSIWHVGASRRMHGRFSEKCCECNLFGVFFSNKHWTGLLQPYRYFLAGESWRETMNESDVPRWDNGVWSLGSDFCWILQSDGAQELTVGVFVAQFPWFQNGVSNVPDNAGWLFHLTEFQWQRKIWH